MGVNGMSRIIVCGTVGHANAAIAAALLLLAERGANVIETNPESIPIKITVPPTIDRDYLCSHKKSKGDKKRDRSERRRKWGI
jgi:hypothetical protein